MIETPTFVSILPLAAVVCPGIAAILVYRIADPVRRERGLLIGSILTAAVVGGMILTLLSGDPARFSAGEFAPGIPFELVGGPLGLAFAGFVTLVYLAATPVVVSQRPREGPRVYACLLGSQSAVLCAAFAGNLLILFGALEAFTLVTYPLVAHRQDRRSRRARYTYLAYGVTGGIAVLLGARIVYAETGTITFVSGGVPAIAVGESWALHVAAILLAAGFGVKAGLVPFHSWLVRARLANASIFGTVFVAILTTAGVFGIVRVVSDVFGIGNPALESMQLFLVVLAAASAIFGGLMAIGSDRMIDRLVYLFIAASALPLLGVSRIDMHPAVGGLGVAGAHAVGLLVCLFALEFIETDMPSAERREAAHTGFWIGAVFLIGLVVLVGGWYLWLGDVLRVPLLVPILGIVLASHVVAFHRVLLDWGPWHASKSRRIDGKRGAVSGVIANWTRTVSETSSTWTGGFANATLLSVRYPDRAIHRALPQSLRPRYEQIRTRRMGKTGTKLSIVESLYVVGIVLALTLLLVIR